jgi:hypothetical protein
MPVGVVLPLGWDRLPCYRYEQALRKRGHKCSQPGREMKELSQARLKAGRGTPGVGLSGLCGEF